MESVSNPPIVYAMAGLSSKPSGAMNMYVLHTNVIQMPGTTVNQQHLLWRTSQTLIAQKVNTERLWFIHAKYLQMIWKSMNIKMIQMAKIGTESSTRLYILFCL